MFLLVRQCAEPMFQLQWLKVKVTVQGHILNPWILWPLYISWTLWKIFIKFWSNAYLITAVCRALDSTTQTMGQGTPWISCLFHISGTFKERLLNLDQMFIWVWRYVFSRTYELATKTQGQGHTIRSWDLPLNWMSATYLLNPLNDFH